jgi:CubicO group peptidase (beta-lactamase class C family)
MRLGGNSLPSLASSPAQNPGQQKPPTDQMQQRTDSYYSDGAFPKAGRSLSQKIDEAKAFLKKEIPKTGSIGVSVSVVYKDQVVISEGYGKLSSNGSTMVTKDSLFQIGSVTKTMIALAIGLLVEDGKVQWEDTVKKHVPWFQLVDKYAEADVTIGNLLSMNSGFGRTPDLAAYAGAYNSSRALMEALAFCDPDTPLRKTPFYSNTNYHILGQLIEEVSGKTWDVLLNERIFKPLGMTNTFASVEDVPASLYNSSLNAGHYVCKGQVIGPMPVDSREAKLAPTMPRWAPGTTVSSAADMATFLQLMLSKGKVGKTTVFQSPTTIAAMMTGKSVAAQDFTEALPVLDQAFGLHFTPDGGTYAAGYGLDVVGHLLWGRAFVGKDGDTFLHHAISSVAPNDRLGMVVLMNSDAIPQLRQCRSYVMGIFLDVPKDVLDYEFKKWRAATDQLTPPLPGAPECGLDFWTNPPRLPLTPAEAATLVGEYTALASAKYHPKLTITRSSKENEFEFEMGYLKGVFAYVTDVDIYKVFLPVGVHSLAFQLAAVFSNGGEPPGFAVNILGVNFIKQTQSKPRRALAPEEITQRE